MPTNILNRVGQSKNMLSSIFEPASIKYKVLGWSWMNYHDICGFRIMNSFLHIIHNEGEMSVMYPIRLLQDFCFPHTHTQEDVVYDVNNTLSTSQGFYVEHRWSTQLHSKNHQCLGEILLSIILLPNLSHLIKFPTKYTKNEKLS
jgi:hypothetical protein